MKITIESTADSVLGRGRIWRGVTEAGVPCLVMVTCIGTESDAARDAIQAELSTLPELREESRAVITLFGAGKSS